MIMPGRRYSALGNYRYGFNGKASYNEADGEGNAYDYGERVFDSRTGRFYSVDPLSRDYPELSAYHYAHNNPIFNIDLDGLEGTGGAQKVLSQSGSSVLRVATKSGIEQGARVV